ncbi:MAG: hypothetical protein ABEJ05_03815 [Haloglomus sp.]
MTPERKVLLGDGLVAVSVLLPALFYFGTALVWWVPLPAAMLSFTTAAAQHYTEHVGFARVRDEALLSLGVIVLPIAVAAVLVVTGSPLGPPLALAVFAGTGIGFLAYRFVFGVLRPIPEKRLARAGERAV